jgi:hypothetical protein
VRGDLARRIQSIDAIASSVISEIAARPRGPSIPSSGWRRSGARDDEEQEQVSTPAEVDVDVDEQE